ncbi:cysteine-rich venom latisemin-like isoform X2 [Brachionus plicatilis]|uniref:Cysteine-rich venom latisemin-like isoform X2 n=1 Tax=Brachionus plicatilis TaxID=10195 RepID=A0A3M7T9S2_BRAPC|nr:cysteine-rich venom latisemin-like isoform X2 [Brachionus plicatilis]
MIRCATLLILVMCFLAIKKIKSSADFKCVTDGLFEDEMDCEAYYECMWIGTAFQKQVHNHCPQKLIYNPSKHRCDSIYEFEAQFSKGIQSGEELVEFMRYRNCIESKHIESKLANITVNQSLNKSALESNLTKKEVKDFDLNMNAPNSGSYITVEILSKPNNGTKQNETSEQISSQTKNTNTGGNSKKMGTLNQQDWSKMYQVHVRKTILDSHLDELSSQVKQNDSEVYSRLHRKRRLLSLDNLFETTAYDEDLTPSTLIEDEIESTDEVYHDKDEIVHQFTNKVMSSLGTSLAQAQKNSIIDSIEETLSKKMTNTTKEYFGDNIVSLRTDIYKDSNFSLPTTQPNPVLNTTKMVESFQATPKSNFSFFNPFKRPLKFLKMLPKLNYQDEPKSMDKLSEILNISSQSTVKSDENKTQEENHRLEYEETNVEGSKAHVIRKTSTKSPRNKMETHYTTFFPHKPTTKVNAINMTSFLSVDKTKPAMQTYKINPNKKLPNQFASLRLNYDQDSLITRIDEIEKGGKFQRLRLVPADTLIECKENDFGLECSCSITLSPPKCKQLINSFLSSCRILGCKNNGKCINMAFKYPIPYVCSCPSDFMGSYCEISRKNNIENDYSYNNNSRPVVTSTPKPTITTQSSTVKQMTTLRPNLKSEAAFTEPLCNPNPCMNNAKCIVSHNSFLCLCSNSSFSGRYCESFHKIVAQTTKILPKMEKFTNKFIIPQTKKITPLYRTTTPRAFIWQCPSNCFYNFGRGYCTLSAGGTPHCVCRLEWTGVDCSQKNYCLNHRCQHNSTCSNYPEMRSYLCICPQGYSGRFCEISTMAPIISQNLPVAQKLLSNIETNVTNNKVSSMNLPIKNPCEDGGIKCQNNGTCLMSFSHANNKFGFVCICKQGYSGHLCEIEPQVSRVQLDQIVTSSPRLPVPTVSKVEPKKTHDFVNPCKQDPDICRKNPLGNDSYTCVKSFLTQDYTLCLSTANINCKDSNPCLNGGYCVHQETGREARTSWKCECSIEYTGRLCESEICSGIHKLFKNHTMCMANSPNYSSGGINSSDIDLILEMHNSVRSHVEPAASNMQKMYWDVRLQHLAQKRAQLCSVENTGILTRQQPGYGVVIGENLAAGYENWTHVLASWTKEKENFLFKSSSSNGNLLSGHYTQMIYSSAARIGCGYGFCFNSTYERYFVCYYGEMQTYHSRYEPYQEGNKCSGCEKNCVNGLCDCKGVYCLNGGTMDLNTCTCTCPYSTFSGKYCENVICPKEDSPFCSQAMFEDKCWLYPVVRATCPYMCSICAKSSGKVVSNSSIPINSS